MMDIEAPEQLADARAPATHHVLPSTSVDQYAGTLATWFGVQGAEMNGILPILGNFNSADYPTNLGFML